MTDCSLSAAFEAIMTSIASSPIFFRISSFPLQTVKRRMSALKGCFFLSGSRLQVIKYHYSPIRLLSARRLTADSWEVLHFCAVDVWFGKTFWANLFFWISKETWSVSCMARARWPCCRTFINTVSLCSQREWLLLSCTCPEVSPFFPVFLPWRPTRNRCIRSLRSFQEKVLFI